MNEKSQGQTNRLCTQSHYLVFWLLYIYIYIYRNWLQKPIKPEHDELPSVGVHKRVWLRRIKRKRFYFNLFLCLKWGLFRLQWYMRPIQHSAKPKTLKVLNWMARSSSYQQNLAQGPTLVVRRRSKVQHFLLFLSPPSSNPAWSHCRVDITALTNSRGKTQQASLCWQDLKVQIIIWWLSSGFAWFCLSVGMGVCVGKFR